MPVACRHGLTFAGEMGFNSVIIEGDSRTIIKKLQERTDDRSVSGNIILEIIKQAGHFQEVLFNLIPRKANEAAHTMAAWGRNRDEPTYWVEEAPREAESITEKDRLGIG